MQIVPQYRATWDIGKPSEQTLIVNGRDNALVLADILFWNNKLGFKFEAMNTAAENSYE